MRRTTVSVTKTTRYALAAFMPLASALAGCDDRRDRERARQATTEDPRPAQTDPYVRPVTAPPTETAEAPGQATRATPEPARTTGAAARDERKVDEDTPKFLAALHRANQDELELAKLGQQRAQSAEVKSFVQMLLTDHKKADQMVLSYGKRKDVALRPDAEESREKAEDKREILEKLRGLRGAEFDREFTAVMVDEHQKAIELVKDARDDVDDYRLNGMLAELQGSLEKHLVHAKHLADVTKDTERTVDRRTGEDPAATRQGRRAPVR